MAWKAISSVSIISGDSTLKLYTGNSDQYKKDNAYLRYRNDRAMTKTADERVPDKKTFWNKPDMRQIGEPQMRHVATQISLHAGGTITNIHQQMEVKLANEAKRYEDALRGTDGNDGKAMKLNLQTRGIVESHWNANEVMNGSTECPHYKSKDRIVEANLNSYVTAQTRKHAEAAAYFNTFPTALQAGPADGHHFGIDVDGSLGYNETAAKMNKPFLSTGHTVFRCNKLNNNLSRHPAKGGAWHARQREQHEA